MNNTNFERIISLAAKDTKKGSRVVAKVFYRILRKKGFSENQIIDIATNIINCLTESLKGYEKKIENAKEHEENTIKEDSPRKMMRQGHLKNSEADTVTMMTCITVTTYKNQDGRLSF
jgi:hypothetical protein